MNLPGPLTSFLDSDGDLSKAAKFTAYSSGRSPDLSHGRDGQHPPSLGKKEHKGAKFTDTELKILR